MSEWTSIGALIVSTLSFGGSAWALWRTYSNETPYAHIQLQKHGPEIFEGLLTLQNPSRVPICFTKVAVDIPDFRWADYNSALISDNAGGRSLPNEASVTINTVGGEIPGNPLVVPPADFKEVKILIFQPAHSRKKRVRVTAYYSPMDGKEKWKSVSASARTRSDF